MRPLALGLVILGLMAFALPGIARGAEDEMEEILGGFEDDEEPAAETAEVGRVAEAEERRWDLDGELSLGAAYNYIPHQAAALPKQTDFTGLSRMRTTLDLRLDVDLPGSWATRVEGFGFYDFAYRIQGRDQYTREVLDLYEWWAELQEAYVRGTPHERIDLWVGRKIVNWGRSETLRVLDVINPLDNREPGLTDIQNLRRAVTMVRVGSYLGDWSLSALVIPEIRFDLLPPFGSDFNPSPTPTPPKDAPDHWGSGDPEYGFSLEGIFRGWDLSFHAGRFWQNTPRAEPNPVRQVYDRLTLAGAGGNYTVGNWLLKGEFAWFDGIGFLNGSDTSRVDAMAGIEYYGIEETAIALEVVNRHLVDFDAATRAAPDFAEENELEMALRINVDLLNERLHLVGLGVVRGERAQRGAFGRLSAEYELRDALSLTVGVLIFGSGEVPPTSTWGDNDRVFAQIAWSF
jgi:hypothetical protein